MPNPSHRQQSRLDTQPTLATDRLAVLPSDFRLGVSTAAYQIEGAANEGGRGPSIWDTFAHTPGLTANGDNGDVACDHYHRWSDDLGLMADLGIRDYRMSVSWSRLQPSGTGALNPTAVAFYRSLLAGLRERGIRPLVTLYHWDLPQPLEDAGRTPTRSTTSPPLRGWMPPAIGSSSTPSTWATTPRRCETYSGRQGSTPRSVRGTSR